MKGTPSPWQEFAAAPLLPLALAAPLGILVDRHAGVSLDAELLVAFMAMVASFASRHHVALAITTAAL
ncbi:MAG: hypothetical protein ACRCZF_06570, partial [Gemmataceae bacterium]